MKVKQRNVDISKISGYEPHEDGNGYSFDTVYGRAACRNAMPWDETFVSEKFGSLNISLALRQIAGERGAKPMTVNLTDETRRHVALVEVEEDVIERMTKKRRNEPILCIVLNDGVHILDGHHRLARRIRDQSLTYRVHMLRGETLQWMQIKWYILGGGGKWELDHSRTRSLEKFVEGADQMFEKLVKMNGL